MSYLDTKRRMDLRLAARKLREVESGEAIERALQEQRNIQHRIEVARAFATVSALTDAVKQEVADKALTDYLGGRQARLDEAGEES